MISFLLDKLKPSKNKKQNNLNSQLTEKKVSKNLNVNLEIIRNTFGESNDIVIHKFNISNEYETQAAIIYIDGLVNKDMILESVLKPLVTNYENKDELPTNIKTIESKLICSLDSIHLSLLNEIIDETLNGNTILIVDGLDQALSISSQGCENRGVQEPKIEVNVRGPREGFSELLSLNMSLIRRKIKSPKLTFKNFKVGRVTKTNVSIAYIKDIAENSLVEEVEGRISGIKTDSILESGYIEQLIEDAPKSLFPTIANTERPDVVAAKLLEGKVAIITEGTPFVLTVPMLFVENFQKAEDYYSRAFLSSLIINLRFIGFALSLLIPAIYVAFTSFHQEAIPTPLLISMAISKEGVPFPAVVEALLMITTFEILREAGIRLPRPIGQAVSIVGALVIGEAAVSAGLVSAPMVIVVAFTAITSFMITPLYDVLSILRIVFILSSSFMGIVGISASLLIILIHLASLRSFGIPYLFPLAPVELKDLKEIFIRTPIKSKNNYGYYNSSEKKKQGDLDD
jgi:spore germination protein KA